MDMKAKPTKPRTLPMPIKGNDYASRPEPEVTMPADSSGREQVGKEIQHSDGSSTWYPKPTATAKPIVDPGFSRSVPKGSQPNHHVTDSKNHTKTVK